MAAVAGLRLPVVLVTALVLVLVAALPAPASADVGITILTRCERHESISGYSVAAYRRALHEMSALESEYGECSELIAKAELVGTGALPAAGAAGRPASGLAVAPTRAERRSIESASHTPGRPVRVGARVLVPGVVHVHIASAVNDLPRSLLATLVLVCGAGLVAVGRGLVGLLARYRRAAARL